MSKLNHLLDLWEDPMKDLYDLEVESLFGGIYFNNKNQINLEESLKKIFYVVDRYSTFMFNSQHEYTSLTIFRDDQIHFSVLDENKNLIMDIVVPTFSADLIKQFIDIIKPFKNENILFKIYMTSKGQSRIRFEEKMKLVYPKDISKEIKNLLNYNPPEKILDFVEELITKRNLFNIHFLIIKYNDAINDEIQSLPSLEEEVPDYFVEKIKVSYESALHKAYEGIELKRVLLNMLKNSGNHQE